MGRQGELAASLLILVLMAYICEAALLRRSSAADFLKSGREKRAARCANGDCSSESSESEEILEANSDYVSVFSNTEHTLTSFYKQPFGSVAYITGHKTNSNLL
ncbi:hypothetical protein C0J50_7156 [Silurus asotus]|uniref:Uncharacterized protein n=1 Tax=Silurus asotus TaxID=30991 RepID=A0AAD5A037_SILAS|nr:hypothetical protein C0J50_7156 [Silurus asotus]